jgi:hypothetical protein
MRCACRRRERCSASKINVKSLLLRRLPRKSDGAEAENLTAGNDACLIDETPLQTIDRGGRCLGSRQVPVHGITLQEKLIGGA